MAGIAGRRGHGGPKGPCSRCVSQLNIIATKKEITDRLSMHKNAHTFPTVTLSTELCIKVARIGSQAEAKAVMHLILCIRMQLLLRHK